ncbi:sialic acid TRAP transporter substrate-binding protein SiaP [Virgibacillus sp. SK37]|uniref:sialic acid TRAP transporter substrate-binding protein SiaP n=1 Tax=Virgibacillus sp. SK37 TaxID=403957 RepID=UPI0004D10329|nr:sialic acid TRAP transporter substrate-binding protein SiaP [Virgibacillus sp. SK37]AIF44378.1 sialic acid-binding protein [Virgibacillus sp. SK37]
MKKSLLYLGILLLALVGLAACSDDSGEGSAEGGDSKESYELKFGMVAGNQQVEYKAAEKLAEYVDKESDGQLSIKIYPSSQLGDDRAMLEQLQEGTLDVTLAEAGRFGIWEPRASLLALPYVVDDFEQLKAAINNTDYGKNLLKDLEEKHNWKVVASAYNGTRQTTSNRAIEKLEDMKGLKLRVPEAETLLDYAKYTGASATPMAFTEVYTALQTNAVDGQENPLTTIDAQKFYEVQDYLAMTNHVVNDNEYVVSTKTLEKLPEDLQGILIDGINMAADEHTKMVKKQEEELVSKFEDEGVTVTEPDLAPFKEAVSEAYPSYLKEIGDGAEDYLKQIQEAK